MILRVLGAAGEVTGSSYLLEAGKSRVIVDFGLHQGKHEEEKNKAPLTFAPNSIDAVLLTHAHLDHTGRVPLLVKRGFQGKVFATSPTVDLVQVLWKDSVHIMKEEAEWRSRKNLRKGLPPVEPLYSEEDVEQALQFLSPVSYDDIFEVAPGIKVRCRDAGHILGSANLEVWLQENGEEVKLVFSGDLGPQDTVMERNPSHIESADYVIIESTYGDRTHKTNLESREEFREVLLDAVRQKSKVLIPTFVVDRAQRVLYEIMLLQKEGVLDENIPVYFDSPMGVKATKIYEKYLPLLSREIQEQIQKGNNPFSPEQLRYVSGVEESRSINDVSEAIVLAGSGMCNGGRIIHHLKHNLWDPTCHVVFVGYQAVGTLGRRLVEGESYLKIAGEEINVQAQLHTINGFSAHADRRDLLKWAGNFKNGPTFIVTHGEPKSSLALAEGIKELGYRAEVPAPGQEFRLERGSVLPLEAVDSLGKLIAPREMHQEDLLAEMANIVAALQEEELPLSSDMLPLLESSKTLLEIIRKKTLEEEKRAHRDMAVQGLFFPHKNMTLRGKIALVVGIFFVALLLVFARRHPWEDQGLFSRPSKEKTLFLRVRYCGQGGDLSAFGSLGSEVFSLPRGFHASEFLEFFVRLKSLGEWGDMKKKSFSLEAYLFWNEKSTLWEGFILSDLIKNPDEEKILPWRSIPLSEETLFFSSAVSEKRAREFTFKALASFRELGSSSLSWEFSDGGFFCKEIPLIFQKPLLFRGNFSLSPGREHFSWNLEDSEIFSEEIQSLPIWKKQVRYPPIFIPSPLIAEGGCSDMGSLIFIIKKALTLDALRKENRLVPEKWSALLEKGLARFSSRALPLAFVIGGKSQLFQAFLPGVLLHFPEGGERACARVKNLWRRLSFPLKPLEIPEETLCGGLASFPVSLLITALEGETLGGLITENSFMHSKLQKSRYSLFFGETPSLAWFILDIPMLHRSMEEFFLDGGILGQIPFRFLPLAHTATALGSQLSSLGVLGCAFWGNGKGEIILSKDSFR